eukprot:jgi/Mesvir1/28213/Mv04766-RA.1
MADPDGKKDTSYAGMDASGSLEDDDSGFVRQAALAQALVGGADGEGSRAAMPYAEGDETESQTEDVSPAEYARRAAEALASVQRAAEALATAHRLSIAEEVDPGPEAEEPVEYELRWDGYGKDFSALEEPQPETPKHEEEEEEENTLDDNLSTMPTLADLKNMNVPSFSDSAASLPSLSELATKGLLFDLPRRDDLELSDIAPMVPEKKELVKPSPSRAGPADIEEATPEASAKAAADSLASWAAGFAALVKPLTARAAETAPPSDRHPHPPTEGSRAPSPPVTVHVHPGDADVALGSASLRGRKRSHKNLGDAEGSDASTSSPAKSHAHHHATSLNSSMVASLLLASLVSTLRSAGSALSSGLVAVIHEVRDAIQGVPVPSSTPGGHAVVTPRWVGAARYGVGVAKRVVAWRYSAWIPVVILATVLLGMEVRDWGSGPPPVAPVIVVPPQGGAISAAANIQGGGTAGPRTTSLPQSFFGQPQSHMPRPGLDIKMAAMQQKGPDATLGEQRMRWVQGKGWGEDAGEGPIDAHKGGPRLFPESLTDEPGDYSTPTAGTGALFGAKDAWGSTNVVDGDLPASDYGEPGGQRPSGGVAWPASTGNKGSQGSASVGTGVVGNPGIGAKVVLPGGAGPGALRGAIGLGQPPVLRVPPPPTWHPRPVDPNARFLFIFRLGERLANAKKALLDLIKLAKVHGLVLVEPALAGGRLHACAPMADPKKGEANPWAWSLWGSIYRLGEIENVGVQVIPFEDFLKLPRINMTVMSMGAPAPLPAFHSANWHLDCEPLFQSLRVVDISARAAAAKEDPSGEAAQQVQRAVRRYARDPAVQVLGIDGHQRGVLWDTLGMEDMLRLYPALGHRSLSPRMVSLIREVKTHFNLGDNHYLGVHWRSENEFNDPGSCLHGKKKHSELTRCFKRKIDHVRERMAAGRYPRVYLATDAHRGMGSDTLFDHVDGPEASWRSQVVAQGLELFKTHLGHALITLDAVEKAWKNNRTPLVEEFLVLDETRKRTVATVIEEAILVEAADFMPLHRLDSPMTRYITGERLRLQQQIKKEPFNADSFWDFFQ